MKRIISIILSTLLICCSFGLVSFADTYVAEPETTAVVTHDLFVSVMDSEDLAANADTLENVDHYTMCIPLTDKEFKKLAKFTRDELKNYLTIQDGLNSLTNVKNKNTKIEKQGDQFSSLSLDQMVEGVITPMSNQVIDNGILTTVLSVSNQNTTTLCKKKIDFNFDWSPVPSTKLTDSAAVGFSGMYLGLTNITSVSGWQQHMPIGSSTWGTKQSITTSISGNGIETHGINPQVTDFRLQGGVTFTASNPKTAVTAGAYFIAFGQYAHTRLGLTPPTASIGTGGFTWSVPLGTSIIKSTQETKSNIITY